jgi:hypothetical protein
MPIAKRKTASKVKPRAKSATDGMSPSQKTIFNKLKRKWMSDKQAHAFSHHAAKKKDAATRNRMAANPKTAKKVSKKAPVGKRRGTR